MFEELLPALKVVMVVRLQIIFIATLCESGTLNPSLISPQAPFPSTSLTVYLVVSSGGKQSEVRV